MKKATLVKLGLSFAGILALAACGNSSNNSSSETEDGKAKIHLVEYFTPCFTTN